MATPAGASSKNTQSSAMEAARPHAICATTSATGRGPTHEYSAMSATSPATRTRAPAKKSRPAPASAGRK